VPRFVPHIVQFYVSRWVPRCADVSHFAPRIVARFASHRTTRFITRLRTRCRYRTHRRWRNRQRTYIRGQLHPHNTTRVSIAPRIEGRYDERKAIVLRC
jgi:hypothetical protein